MSKRVIVLTGGGTAGHVVSNIAIIPELKRHNYEIHYIGRESGIERDMVEKIPDVEYHSIRSGKLRRYFSMENAKDVVRVAQGYFDAKKILKKIDPDIVFSKGGFVTVPVVYAASSRKIPVVLHESDYSPGLSNKLGNKVCDKVLTTFEDTLKSTGSKGKQVGIPLRHEILQGDKQAGLDYLGFSGAKPVLLVMGGSQGAQALNDTMIENRERLLDKFDIVHIAGTGKTQGLAGDEHYRVLEFTDRMPDILAASDIAISRAGANGIFELLATRTAMVLVPLPLSASRGDQIENSKYFKKKGFAEIVYQEEMGEKLIDTVNSVFADREKYLVEMDKEFASEATERVVLEINDSVKKS